jgi:hypothetical protein
LVLLQFTFVRLFSAEINMAATTPTTVDALVSPGRAGGSYAERLGQYSNNKSSASFELVDVPTEIILGESMEITLAIMGEMSPYDWVGIYPVNIPSLPGLSHGRWKYISTFMDHKTENGLTGSKDATVPKVVKVRFEQGALPNHSGELI